MFSNSNADSCIKLLPDPVPHLCPSSPPIPYWWLANLTFNFPSLTDLTDQTSKATGPVGGNLSTLHDPGSRIQNISQYILSARKSSTIKEVCSRSSQIWKRHFPMKCEYKWILHLRQEGLINLIGVCMMATSMPLWSSKSLVVLGPICLFLEGWRV